MAKNFQEYLRNNLAWILLVVAFFALIYVFALTFISIDGDHAAALTYHLVERNEDIQRPYFFYHGMMDVVVSLIPAEYEALETWSVFITATAAVALVIALITLLFEWLKQLNIPIKHRWLIALVILLASPEYFFFGLVFNPSAISMLLMIIAHLLLRRVVQGHHQQGKFSGMLWVQIVLSAVCFGLGTAFRWNIGTYGAIIFMDVLLLHMQLHEIKFAPGSIPKLFSKPIFILVGWGVLALVLAVVSIYLSGYDLTDIQLQLSNVENSYDGIGKSTAKNLLPFISPAFAMISGIGFLVLLYRRSLLILLFFIGAVLVAPVFVSGVPKQLLPAVPAVSLFAVVGFHFIWYQIENTTLQRGMQGLFLIVLLVPWFVGVTIEEEDAQYGLWFEPMPYDREEITDEGVRFHIGPGRAYNTPEGFRPLFGYSFVFAGDWRDFMQEQNDFYHVIVQEAIDSDLPIVVTMYPNAYEVNRLIGLGYTTTDVEYREFDLDPQYVERRFVNEEGDSVTVLYHELLTDSSPEELIELRYIAERYDTIIWRGYMHTLRHAYYIAPETLTRLTPNSAILDLQGLMDAIEGENGE